MSINDTDSNPGRLNRIRGRAQATNTADYELLAAPGDGFRNWISSIVVYNSSASNGTSVELKSGSTVIWTMPAPPGNGGSIIALPDPIGCNPNEALNFATDDSVATITVSVAGFTAQA